MAQKKVVIKTIEEANCTNCIYGQTGESITKCLANAPRDTSATIHFPQTFWCGEGKWLVEQRDAGHYIETEYLYRVYDIFEGVLS